MGLGPSVRPAGLRSAPLFALLHAESRAKCALSYRGNRSRTGAAHEDRASGSRMQNDDQREALLSARSLRQPNLYALQTFCVRSERLGQTGFAGSDELRLTTDLPSSNQRLNDHFERKCRGGLFLCGEGQCCLEPSRPYSHSIVPGGLDVTSSTTRLMPRIWLMMRLEIACKHSRLG